MERPEILAPAGGWEALVAAVESGADAVYLGGKAFNARASAANFDEETLRKALDYAHLRGVRIYVTVNILLADRELPEALDYLRFLYEAGVDAVIIQDLGVGRLIRRLFPDWEVHGSTQMTIHSVQGAAALEEWGFDRVVLAREMTLPEVAACRLETGIGLEVFIHGALCFAYSGQCLMSSLIGGRSGNRGRCAQPCRMEYVLVDERGRPALTKAGVPGRHLLSTRDLIGIEHIPGLIEAGVGAFKIEGRMKRPEYVATVVRTYREAVDRAMAYPEEYVVTDEEKDRLARIFNREFTPGYLSGNPGRALVSPQRPNNRGVPLGVVKGYDRDRRLVVRLERILNPGDGIEVWGGFPGSQESRGGLTVGAIFVNGVRVESAGPGRDAAIEFAGRARPGDRVFLTSDARLLAEAAQGYAPGRFTRRIPLQAKVYAASDEPLRLWLADDRGNNVEAETGVLAQEAHTRPLTKEVLEDKLGRLGNTPFELKNLNAHIQGGIMVPLSQLNEVRRLAVSRLEEARLAAYRREPLGPEWKEKARSILSGAGETSVLEGIVLYGIVLEKIGERSPGQAGISQRAEIEAKPLLAIKVRDLGALRAALQNGADLVYWGAEAWASLGRAPLLEEVNEARQECRQAGVPFVLATPRIAKDQEMAPWLTRAEKLDPDGVLIGNLGLWRFFRRNGSWPLRADWGLNLFNSPALEQAAEMGFVAATLSPEMTLGQIRDLRPPEGLSIECLVLGTLQNMVSEHCVVGAWLGGEGHCARPCRENRFFLKDRKGIMFPLEMDECCRMHVLNAMELCLVDDLGRLASAGVGVIRIEASRHGARYLRTVTQTYRRAIDGESLDEDTLRQLASLSGAITKGHLFRGVLGVE